MNHIAISSILISITSLSSAIFITLLPPKNQIKTMWGIFNVIVFIWSSCVFFHIINDDYNTALFVSRIGQQTGLFIAVVFLHFVIILTNTHKIYKTTIFILYAFFILLNLLFIAKPSLYIEGLRILPNIGYDYIPGPLYIIFLLSYIATVGYGLVILHNAYKISSIEKQNQLKYVLAGYLIGSTGGATCFLATYNIYPEAYLYGNYLVPIYILLVLYAIAKHQLMDIRIVIKTSLIYTLSVALITIFYTVIIFMFQYFYQETFGYQDFWITLTGVVFITLLFLPIRDLMQKCVDKVLFKRSPVEIVEENKSLRREINDKEKHKAVATLSSGIAHDIRGPITALKTFFEYYPEKKNDPAFMQKFVDLGNKELNRIENLTKNLLDFAKPSPSCSNQNKY